MYYYKARMYSPTLGRFMQTDPIGYEDNVNLYAYVANDPMNGVDPTGMYECEGTEGQCADLEVYRQNLEKAANTPQTGTRIRDPRLTAAVRTLGEAGDGGVTVTFENEDGGTMGSYDQGTDTINLDYDAINARGNRLAGSGNDSQRRRARGRVGGGVLAHEAYHRVRPPSAASTIAGAAQAHYFAEYDAYQVEQNYYLQLGYPAEFGNSDIHRRARASCVGGADRYNHPQDWGTYESNCR